ncbi:MAG: ATP-dependent zinc metalloprotease FtsH [Oscillospiraceae bacterium]|nr:ATP-dependent zinc metalloprotease FtsH [Oscillospiraceae bacterium]
MDNNNNQNNNQNGNNNGNNNRKLPTPPVRRGGSPVLYLLLILLVALTVWWMLRDNSTADITRPQLQYSDIVREFKEHNVKSFVLKDTELTLVLKDQKDFASDTIVYSLYSIEVFYNDVNDFITEEMESPEFGYDLKHGLTIPLWLSMLGPTLLIVLVIVFVVILNRNMGAAGGGMKFGKAKTRLSSENKQRVTFRDVAGADEEKEELKELVDFLKSPKKYEQIGARIPKGVLLVGPPGTGKTLLARAVAGEAGVEFISISGSDFVELYVGVGASRVRDLFEQAKKVAPSIIFIDEIDAVGRKRGAGLGGGHDEREQTLNQLLVEMDGFMKNEEVIVIAATNRADILDNALLRPGRFDRQVYVGYPDIKGREEILEIHVRGKRLGEDVNLRHIAAMTAGFTGADLENLLNEAALLAARYNSPVIRMEDVENASIKVIAGPAKKSRVVSEKSRKLTAYHEAGHAVASYFLKNVDPVHHITIVPHGAAGGMTIYRPDEDRDFRSRTEMFERIVTALGGRVAESLFLDDISTGASSDIQQASALARDMVMVYGMSPKIGPISYDDSSHSVFIGRDFGQTKSYSEKTAAEIDDEVRKMFKAALTAAETILREHASLVVMTAEYLLKNETMDGDTFAGLCKTGSFADGADSGIISVPPSVSETLPDYYTEPEAPETDEASGDGDFI